MKRHILLLHWIVMAIAIVGILVYFFYKERYIYNLMNMISGAGFSIIINSQGYILYSNLYTDILQKTYLYESLHKIPDGDMISILYNIDISIRYENRAYSTIHMGYRIDCTKRGEIYIVHVSPISTHLSSQILELLSYINDILCIKHEEKVIYCNNQEGADVKNTYRLSNGKMAYVNNVTSIYDHGYSYKYLELIEYKVPIFLQNISVGIIIFDENQIIDANNIMQPYVLYKKNIYEIFAEQEYVKMATAIRQDEKSQIFCIMNDGVTNVMLEICKYNTIYVCSIYFDRQYNYGKTNFLYNQRILKLSEAISGMFHDMNNVMSAILSQVEVIKALEQAPEFKAEVYILQSLIIRTINMLSKLLNTYKNRLPADTVINVDMAISDFVSIVGQPMVSPYQIQIKYSNKADNLMRIRVCLILLDQILINLVSNSIDAITASSNKNGLVHITTGYHFVSHPFWNKNNMFVSPGKYVEIGVTDNGSGISADNIDKIFQRHFTTKTKNTGLGLSTVYNIIKSYHGFINIVSNNGITSIFVYLPQCSDDVIIEGSLEMMKPENSTVHSILFVDDNITSLDAYYKVLTKQNYNIVCLRDGKNVMETLRANPVEMVVMDYNLPYRNGVEVAQEIREAYPNMKIIYVSGSHQDDLNLELGPNELFLHKPFGMEVLMAGIFKLG